jgi:hypothetical protein
LYAVATYFERCYDTNKELSNLSSECYCNTYHEEQKDPIFFPRLVSINEAYLNEHHGAQDPEIEVHHIPNNFFLIHNACVEAEMDAWLATGARHFHNNLMKLAFL